MTLLQTVDLSVAFGAVRAVHELSIDVDAGELVGLIGPNGAGKTTCIDAVCGFTAHEGSIVLDGVPLDGLRPDARARRGVVRSFQQVELFDDLDVRSNLLVAADGGDVSAAVDAFDIGHLLARPTTALSEGERKLVGLARALARRPRVLLCDEPAAGLDTTESRDLGVQLRRVAEGGIGVLLVDHDMELVLGACDRVHVIDRGSLVASGPPEMVRRHPDVIAAYLGSAAA